MSWEQRFEPKVLKFRNVWNFPFQKGVGSWVWNRAGRVFWGVCNVPWMWESRFQKFVKPEPIPNQILYVYIMQIYRYHFMGQIFQHMGHLGHRYISVHCFPVEAQKKPVFDPCSGLSWILVSNTFSGTHRDDGILYLLSVGPEPIVGSM